MTDANDDYMQGYTDGRDKGCPEPNNNRSERYKHSFAVGRAELNNQPIPADVSRKHVEEIEQIERDRT
jgi:hypothetical protein